SKATSLLNGHLNFTYPPLYSFAVGRNKYVDALALDITANIACDGMAISFHMYNRTKWDHTRVNCNHLSIWIFCSIDSRRGDSILTSTFYCIGCRCYSE